MITEINANLHPAQAVVHASPARFKVLSAGRRWGKTRLGVNECLGVASRGGLAWWIAPTYRISKVGWRPLARIARRIPGADVRLGDLEVRLPGGGMVAVRSADSEGGLRGEGLDYVVLDECAFMRESAWFEELRPALSDRLGGALFISTPKGRNWFWNLYNRGLETMGETMGEWQSWQFPTSANPYIDASEIESARQDMAEIIFQQEYMAEFVESEGQVFRRVRECTTSEPATYDAGRQYVAAVDPATAQDYTAVCVMDVEDKRQVFLDRFGRCDYPVLEDRLTAICERYNLTRMRIETNGIGRPVFDHLAASGLPVESFTTTNATKGAIIQSLMAAFEHNEIGIIDSPVQSGELLSFESKKTASGAITYSAPVGVHDDTVMALAMAWDMIAPGGWTIA